MIFETQRLENACLIFIEKIKVCEQKAVDKLIRNEELEARKIINTKLNLEQYLTFHESLIEQSNETSRRLYKSVDSIKMRLKLFEEKTNEEKMRLLPNKRNLSNFERLSQGEKLFFYLDKNILNFDKWEIRLKEIKLAQAFLKTL